jgi:hypothetical protein
MKEDPKDAVLSRLFLESMKTFNHNSRFLGRDVNPRLSEYIAEPTQ